MRCPAPGKEPVVETIILDDTSTAKSDTQCWAREKKANVGEGVCMEWADRSRSDDGRVGAAAVCTHGIQWKTHGGQLGTGRREIVDAEPWVIGFALGEMVKGRERLQEYSVKMVEVLSDSQAAI